jgi:hypothetical protein
MGRHCNLAVEFFKETKEVKRRLGIFLLCMLTLVLLKLISMSLGWCNLDSDVAVFFGAVTLGSIATLSPMVYTKVWKTMINPINTPKENDNEV